MQDFIFENFGWLIFLMLMSVFVGLYFSIKHDNAEQAAFMSACAKDHKEYECTAMWRAGEPSVVPVLIPIGR